MIAHRTVKKRLIECAKELGISYQLEVLTGIGTDAGAIHQQKGGVATGVISIPTAIPIRRLRWSICDLEDAYQLLRQFVVTIKPDDSFAFGK